MIFEKNLSDLKNVFLVEFLFANLETNFSDFQIYKRENIANNKKASETLDRRKTLDPSALHNF